MPWEEMYHSYVLKKEQVDFFLKTDLQNQHKQDLWIPSSQILLFWSIPLCPFLKPYLISQTKGIKIHFMQYIQPFLQY